MNDPQTNFVATVEAAPKRPFGFDLGKLLISTAVAIPVGMAYFWDDGVADPWVWAGGCAWMLGNLYCLDRMIRSLLAPPEERDQRTGAIYGAMSLLGMPILLLLLLFGANQGEAMVAVTAGLTLPMVLVLLRAFGSLLSKGANPTKR